MTALLPADIHALVNACVISTPGAAGPMAISPIRHRSAVTSMPLSPSFLCRPARMVQSHSLSIKMTWCIAHEHRFNGKESGVQPYTCPDLPSLPPKIRNNAMIDLKRLRAHPDNKTKQAMQRDCEQAADELEAMREMLAVLLALPVAKTELEFLYKGIGTATQNAAWLRAARMLGTT